MEGRPGRQLTSPMALFLPNHRRRDTGNSSSISSPSILHSSKEATGSSRNTRRSRPLGRLPRAFRPSRYHPLQAHRQRRRLRNAPVQCRSRRGRLVRQPSPSSLAGRPSRLTIRLRRPRRMSW
jgi:hypothetical protein